MKRVIPVVSVVAAMLATSTTTSAQPQGGRVGRGMMVPGRMQERMQEQMQDRAPARGRGGVPAGLLLRSREQLKLTDAQAKRLEALVPAQREALKPQTPAQLRARAELVEGRQRDNLDAQRAALEKLAKLRVDAQVAWLKASKDARDVLTPEQRTRAAALMRAGAAQRKAMRRDQP